MTKTMRRVLDWCVPDEAVRLDWATDADERLALILLHGPSISGAGLTLSAGYERLKKLVGS